MQNLNICAEEAHYFYVLSCFYSLFNFVFRSVSFFVLCPDQSQLSFNLFLSVLYNFSYVYVFHFFIIMFLSFNCLLCAVAFLASLDMVP